MLKVMLEGLYPGIAFGPAAMDDRPLDWFVLSAINTGVRPVRIEKAILVLVETDGPGTATPFLAHDALLSEDHRRTTLAFTEDLIPGNKLWMAAFVDDTGKEYGAFGPLYASWFARRRWKRRQTLAASRVSTVAPLSSAGRSVDKQVLSDKE